ncbi:MAG: DUF3592 domain-containing protein [Eubacteriales bacterium]|nr:DUF3592 domain-containing protein [Eubacteriales bacterium]
MDIKMKCFLWMAGFWIAAIVCSVQIKKIDADYRERGIAVQATIYDIKPVVRHKEYTCYYLNDAGKRVYANLTLNRSEGYVGQVVEGYYLPETPNYVYCFASKGLKFIVLGAFYGFAIIFTFAFVTNILSEREDKLIEQKLEQYASNYDIKDQQICNDVSDSNTYHVTDIYDKDVLETETQTKPKSTTGLKLKE